MEVKAIVLPPSGLLLSTAPTPMDSQCSSSNIHKYMPTIIRNNLITKLRTVVNTGATKLASTTRSQNKCSQQFFAANSTPLRHLSSSFPFRDIIPDLVPSRRRVPCLNGVSSACVASTTIRPLMGAPNQEFSDADVWLYHMIIISLLL